jgi:hypothetical protein
VQREFPVTITHSSELIEKKAASSRVWFFAAMGLILALSIVLRLTSGTTPDVSWLIDMSARILDGERAYIDIFETTPPVPVLLYMPGAFAEQITGIGAEFFVYGYFYAIYLACLWLAWRILPSRLEGVGDVRFGIILPAAIFLFLLSHDSIAQRETMAAALVLPMLAVIIAYGEKGKWVAGDLRFWAAFLVGLSAAVKPPIFALPVLLLGGWLLWRDKSLRALWSSGLVLSGMVAVALTILSLMAYPEYLGGVTQLMRDIYVPIRSTDGTGLGLFTDAAMALLNTNASLPLVMLAAIFVFSPKLPSGFRLAQSYQLLVLLSAGYIFVFLLQGKFFGYHIVPAAMLAFVGLWARVASLLSESGIKQAAKSLKGIAAVLLVMVMAAGSFEKLDDDHKPMQDFSWAQNLDHPTAIAMAPDISIGFPLARKINAQWIDRIHSQWAVYYANLGMARSPKGSAAWQIYQKYYQSEITRTITLIEQVEPDLIIQCIAPACLWLNEAMLAESPLLLDNYQEATRQGRTIIWRRKPVVSAP